VVCLLGRIPGCSLIDGLLPFQVVELMVCYPFSGLNMGFTPSVGLNMGFTPSIGLNMDFTPSLVCLKGFTPTMIGLKGFTPSADFTPTVFNSSPVMLSPIKIVECCYCDVCPSPILLV